MVVTLWWPGRSANKVLHWFVSSVPKRDLAEDRERHKWLPWAGEANLRTALTLVWPV